MSKLFEWWQGNAEHKVLFLDGRQIQALKTELQACRLNSAEHCGV